MADTILFEDIFDVKDIDPDGPKFDRGIEKRSLKEHKFGKKSILVYYLKYQGYFVKVSLLKWILF